MKYSRFEDLPVWKAAAELFVRVDRLRVHPGFVGTGDTKDQLQRSALSVSNNIAEGFELGTTEQLITFLYYARGSPVKHARCCESWSTWGSSRISRLKCAIWPYWPRAFRGNPARGSTRCR